MSESRTDLDSAIRHGYAQLGDVRLHYAESGGGERLVILLHGFPECWYSWRHQLASLGARYHVVAPDMRGYNLSDKPPRVDDYRMPALVQDVVSLIHHFGAERAVIVGHDWGAAVGWAIAERYPEHVEKLVAMQVPPPSVWAANMTLKQALMSWYMLFFQIPRLPEWWISRNDFAALERMFKTTARHNTFTDTDIAVYKEALRRTGALTASVNYYRANLRMLLSRMTSGGRSDGGRIRVPTFFIYGERDMAIAPETVRGVERYVDAPYRELRLGMSGHWVHQESAAEVNAALSSFLED